MFKRITATIAVATILLTAVPVWSYTQEEMNNALVADIESLTDELKAQSRVIERMIEYINKQTDKIKDLKKKIKSIRKEVVQLGFETCYKKKRFKDILTLASKLDKKILEESGELKEFVDAAEIMVSGLS